MDPKVMRDQAIKDAKAALILDAARKVFSDREYSETRLEDIAAVSGFSKASLYNYYSDKEEIFVTLAIREFDSLLYKLKNLNDQKEPLIMILENIVRTILLFFGENYAFLLAIANFRISCQNNVENSDPKIRSLVQRFKQKYAELLEFQAQILRNAKKKGEILSQVPENVLSNYILSLIRGVLFDWKVKGSIGDTDREIRQLMVFLENGLNIRKNEFNGR